MLVAVAVVDLTNQAVKAECFLEQVEQEAVVKVDLVVQMVLVL
jgi:hypothetical protein